MSIQNIINGCFAICITLLIYQNTQLKDKLETGDFFAQHSVDEAWDRSDQMELNHDQLSELIEIINTQVILNEDEIDKLFGNFDIVQKREKTTAEGLLGLVELVERNRINIIEVLDFVGDLHGLE